MIIHSRTQADRNHACFQSHLVKVVQTVQWSEINCHIHVQAIVGSI